MKRELTTGSNDYYFIDGLSVSEEAFDDEKTYLLNYAPCCENCCIKDDCINVVEYCVQLCDSFDELEYLKWLNKKEEINPLIKK